MRPEEIENKRYATDEYNSIRAEERSLLRLLDSYARERGVSPTAVRVLDIGCGSGRVTMEIVQRGYQVRGLEFSETALAYARKRGLDVAYCNLDEGIAAADGAYDVVWAGDIIEHVFDPIGVMKEVQRVLKPGGTFLFSIPSDVGLVSRIKMLFGISHQEEMYRRAGYYKHHTFFSPRLMQFMVDQAGLRLAVFEKILNLGARQLKIRWLPSAFFNEMIVRADKAVI